MSEARIVPRERRHRTSAGPACRLHDPGGLMDSSERLKRVRAGLYVSADERFTVEDSDGAWYVRDAERSDQLGQPMLTGPYATLGEARHAIGTLREIGS